MFRQTALHLPHKRPKYLIGVLCFVMSYIIFLLGEVPAGAHKGEWEDEQFWQCGQPGAQQDEAVS
jgi:hypothetical protein